MMTNKNSKTACLLPGSNPFARTHVSILAAALTMAMAPVSTAWAGGPLAISGSSQPIVYASPDVTVHLEDGDLGGISNTQADGLVRDAFDLWNDVSTSTINLQTDDTAIVGDVSILDYTTYLPAPNMSAFKGDDGLNPLIYDETGEIIDEYFGDESSDSIIGVAFSESRNGTNFSEGYALINGSPVLQAQPQMTNDAYRILIAHEIGHFFGLDHSQIDIDNTESANNFTVCNTRAETDYPVMYPFICRETPSLHPDDASAVSALYPDDSFAGSYGIIEGRFVEVNGAAILGANIWAENTSTGEVISIVSDYLLESNGYYKLHLPPGSYTLHANSINDEFVGASGVGPYSLDIADLSFQAPHPLTEVVYRGNQDVVEVINVRAGITQTISFNTTGAPVFSGTIGTGGGGGGALGVPLMVLTAFSMLWLRRKTIST